ncbi:hypothetical protein [Shigella dysenteriae]|nr:hypothetical protein [Shigella dysenteriae]WNT50348.1 hypothetical protein PWP84_18690 [Shigella dysenteriae]
MNVNAGHERTSKARIIHQIQLIRGTTHYSLLYTLRKIRHLRSSKEESKCIAYKGID